MPPLEPMDIQTRSKPADGERLILLVEDDFILRSALSELLRDEGYAVESAANGVEALRRLLQPPRPGLVLLDIMMPHMDGLTFRATQLALPAVADVPAIVMSAVDRMHGIGAMRFARALTKPIDTARLLDSIRAIFYPESGPEPQGSA